jgi:hypothetical protein
MADQGDRHVACVNAWLDRTSELSPKRFLDAFQGAFDALWARACRPLGDVTLTAIVDRALATASEAFPALGTVRAEPRRRFFRDFRARALHLSRGELAEAIRFVLVEFLTVLGNLTAEILTPALHAELSRMALVKATPRRGVESDGTPAPPPRSLGGLDARARHGRKVKKVTRPTRARKS